MCIAQIGAYVLVVITAVLAVALVRAHNKPKADNRADRDSYMLTSLRPSTVLTPAIESEDDED